MQSYHTHRGRSEVWADLRLQPQLALNRDLVPDSEVARVLCEHSPFRERSLEPRGLPEFVSGVTGDLIEGRLPVDVLRERYVVAASLVLIARHLLNLGIDADRVQAFGRVISRSPYRVADPLSLVFKRSDEDGSDGAGTGSSENTLLEVAERKERTDVRFKTSDRIQQTIDQAFREVRGSVERQYTQSLHLAFVGYLRVCLPLFAVRSASEERDSQTLLDLGATRGRFYLQLPECLVPRRL